MEKTPQRRYVRFKFDGYAPIDIALQVHLLGKNYKSNMVGSNMMPYEEYLGEYENIHIIKK